MNSSEHVAYVKGLIEGSELNLGDKEKKVLNAIIDMLETVSQELSDAEVAVDELYERTDDLYDCIDDIEDYLDDECDCDDDDCDEYMYDVECPNCHEKICVDEETLLKGDIKCPNCDEKLEFEFDCDCDDCDCDCDDDDCDCGDDDCKCGCKD